MSNLHTHYHFKLHFQNVDQHTGGKLLIHGTKRRKDNQLQSLEPRVEYPSRECKHNKVVQRKHVQSNIHGYIKKIVLKGVSPLFISTKILLDNSTGTNSIE